MWMFIAALFIIAKRWKQSKNPLHRWRNKKYMVYLYNEILFSHRKERSSDTCHNVDDTKQCGWGLKTLY